MSTIISYLGVELAERISRHGVLVEVYGEGILIVGDSQSSDILGGINIGIDTCWYNPEKAIPKYQPNYDISDLLQLKEIL